MKTYVHVNQHKIRANKKDGTDLPVITIKRGKSNTYFVFIIFETNLESIPFSEKLFITQILF